MNRRRVPGGSLKEGIAIVLAAIVILMLFGFLPWEHLA